MTNEILQFAGDPGANVMTQEDYDALAARADGFSAGLARSDQVNKVLRQAVFMACGLAGFLDGEGFDVLDDGDLATLIANITAAVQNRGFSTGDVKPTLKTTADTGWIMLDDGTIGDASSGATTRANADTELLFTLLWTNTTNANCAVSGGRGASAAADFAAHKTIALPKVKGRALAGAGAGSGLTSRALAERAGAETAQLTEVELPEHHHDLWGTTNDSSGNTKSLAGSSVVSVAGSTGGGSGAFRETFTGAAQQIVSDTGAGDPFSIMQPTVFFNFMVKL